MMDQQNGTTAVEFEDALGDDSTLDLADLVDVIDTDSPVDDFPLPEQLHHVLSPTTAHQPVAASHGDDAHDVHSASIVVALFCDGFVCRHWTTKSGWVDGFAQSYDATSRYFLDSLERETLPDGLLELMEQKSAQSELTAEIWDLRSHPTALCPLTSADLPRSAPTGIEGGESVDVRRVILRRREQLVVNATEKEMAHSPDDQFLQLSSNDLEELTNDELESLALSADADLIEVGVEFGIMDDSNNDTIKDEVLGSLPILPGEEGFAPRESSRAAVQIMIDDEVVHEGVDVNDLITPKGVGESSALWASSCLTSPTSFLSPTESKTMPSRSHRVNGVDAALPPSKRSLVNESDDEAPCDSHLLQWPTIKVEHTDTSRVDMATSGVVSSMEQTPEPTVKLQLSPSSFRWTGIMAEGHRAKGKPKKKKNRLEFKPSSRSATPLPATHQFLTKLKGKRPRNYTIDDLSNASPAWMMMKHMNKFYQAALLFERRHSHFLQVNVDRLMKADRNGGEPTKLAAGSMGYLAMQLQPIQRPDQVIVAAAARVHPHKQIHTVDAARSPPLSRQQHDENGTKNKSTDKRSPALAFRSTTGIATPPMTPDTQAPWSPPIDPNDLASLLRSPVRESLLSLGDDVTVKAFQAFDSFDEETFEF